MFFIEKSLITLILGVAIISPLTENTVNAHGGRTNAAGCHTDRKNGGYHCHNSGTSDTPSTSQPICRTISKISSQADLIKEDNSIFKSGEIRDLKRIESKLKGNLGRLISYTVDDFSVKIFNPNNSKIGAVSSFGNNKQWVPITKAETLNNSDFILTVSDNSFGINKVIIKKTQEFSQDCS